MEDFMKTFLIGLSLLFAPALALAGEVVPGTCHFYTSGNPSNFCDCEIKETVGSSTSVYRVVVSCDLLTCEDYEKGKAPKSCDQTDKSVTVIE